MTLGPDRIGVVVVRIWVEGSADGLRARLTQTLDVSEREQTTHVAVSVDEILAVVKEWVEAFLAEADIVGR